MVLPNYKRFTELHKKFFLHRIPCGKILGPPLRALYRWISLTSTSRVRWWTPRLRFRLKHRHTRVVASSRRREGSCGFGGCAWHCCRLRLHVSFDVTFHQGSVFKVITRDLCLGMISILGQVPMSNLYRARHSLPLRAAPRPQSTNIARSSNHPCRLKARHRYPCRRVAK
jgi:hypothetical protein